MPSAPPTCRPAPDTAAQGAQPASTPRGLFRQAGQTVNSKAGGGLCEGRRERKKQKHTTQKAKASFGAHSVLQRVAGHGSELLLDQSHPHGRAVERWGFGHGSVPVSLLHKVGSPHGERNIRE